MTSSGPLTAQFRGPRKRTKALAGPSHQAKRRRCDAGDRVLQRDVAGTAQEANRHEERGGGAYSTHVCSKLGACGQSWSICGFHRETDCSEDGVVGDEPTRLFLFGSTLKGDHQPLCVVWAVEARARGAALTR